MEDSKRFNSQSIPNGSHGETGDDGIRSGSFEACKNNSAFTRIHPLTSHLMEQVCHRDNLNLAYKRVKSNKGAAGVDQMSVSELGLLDSLEQGGVDIFTAGWQLPSSTGKRSKDSQSRR